MRIQDFSSGVGGGGGPGPSVIKIPDNVFIVRFFSSTPLILQNANGLFQRKLQFSEVPEGLKHFFQGGVQLFLGGGPIAYSLLNPI